MLYQLCDAATYTDRHILVVGGGDSAVEAATALAAQPGNVVTLSYRRAEFFRLKQRNQERIALARNDGLNVVFRSEVLHIEPESVTLSLEDGDGGTTTQCLPNHFVFICAGGEPPLRLLREIGVRMGGDADVLQPDREAPVLVGQ